jgi:hypothetical protein
MQQHVGIEQWKQLFQQTGLDSAMMNKWHQLFESQYPQGHQSFLEWLGVAEEQIVQIRNQSK